MNVKTKVTIATLIVVWALPSLGQRIQPEDLEYRGAFRLPELAGEPDWNYSGRAMTYYPSGDPSGPADSYPGSIFALGHDQYRHISEVDIPVPVISNAKNPAELNTATTLQAFSDITGSMFGELEMQTVGLEYLPAQGSQTTNKLYFCCGQHLQYQEATHGWCDLNLSSPQAAGPWHFGDHNNYTTSDYLFEIPRAWADTYTPGMYLASGRFREGVWSGLGPALYACAPWEDGNPPVSNSTLTSITPLLLYGVDDPSIPEIVVSDDRKMNVYSGPDQWSGGAWLTYNAHSAVIFVGTKATGNWWYGYSDGTVYPETPPYPPIPDPPHDNRGYWSEGIQAQILFYDPADFAAVAGGTMETWEPQPYAVMNIDPFLFNPGFDHLRYKKHNVGAACYDRARHLLYIIERLADEDRSLVHVWRVNEPSSGIEDASVIRHFELYQNYPNPFNPSTTIRYSIPNPAVVTLSIYNMLGKEIVCLVHERQSEGIHEVVWDGRDRDQHRVGSGLYVYRLEAAGLTHVQKLTLIR